MDRNVQKIINLRSVRSKLDDVNMMTLEEKALVLSAVVEYENYLTYALEYKIRNKEVEIPAMEISSKNESWRGMGITDPLEKRKERIMNVLNNVDLYQEISVEERIALLESLKHLINSYDTLEAMVEKNKEEYDYLLDISDKMGSK